MEATNSSAVRKVRFHTVRPERYNACVDAPSGPLCRGSDRFQAFASPPARRIVPDRGYPRQHFEFDPKDECRKVRIFAYILIRFDFVSWDRPVNERPLYAIPP